MSFQVFVAARKKQGNPLGIIICVDKDQEDIGEA
jgi:hypothetical protein